MHRPDGLAAHLLTPGSRSGGAGVALPKSDCPPTVARSPCGRAQVGHSLRAEFEGAGSRTAAHELLLDYVARPLSAHAVLNAFDPDWRERYHADGRFAVEVAEDGNLSIVERKG